MPDERTRVVRAYAESVFRRGREPMEPVGFTPDWADQPSRHKTYLGVRRFPLPAGGDVPCADTAGVLFAPPEGAGPPWTPEALAALLRMSCGVLDRRLRVSWNQDSDVRALYPEALWGRGAASGGGMYPLEVYWVAGPGAPLAPGVYHYSTAHHAFERLLAGDVTDEIRAALAGEDADADGFLLVTVRFWKNAFKYNSFSYHVVTQDAGALLGCWELLARGLGRRLARVLWFDDERLDRVLGLDTGEESTLAVVPLRSAPDAAGPPRSRGTRIAAGRPWIDRPSFERSARTTEFPQVAEVHRAVLDDRRPRPDRALASALEPAAAPAGDEVVLPAPLEGRLGRDVGAVLRDRRTSFGSFVRSPLDLGELATVLAGTASGRRHLGDTAPEHTGLTGLYVLANRVEGLPSGTYRYDPRRHVLGTVAHMDLSERLQRLYYLSNYNLEQVGAVLAISARLDSALAAYGSRGYRIINSEVGALAQTACTTAAALGAGCGAVLGFDNIAIDEAVGLDGSDERTFLFVLLGHERADRADFDHRLL